MNIANSMNAQMEELTGESWISVRDSLPSEEYTPLGFLVLRNGCVKHALYSRDCGFYDYNESGLRQLIDGVTHWLMIEV